MLRDIAVSILLVSFASAGNLLAKSKEPRKNEKNQSNTGEFTFRVPVDVVVVNATAQDEKGNPVRDLRKEDFRIYEDGQPQPIHTFSVETYTSRRQQVQADERNQNRPPGEPNQAEPGEARFISIVFDDIISPSFADLAKSVEAVKQFVREGMAPSDLVAMMSASGRYVNSFTGDRSEILDQLNTVHTKFNYSQPASFECPKLSSGEALEMSRNHLDPITMEALIQHTIVCAGFDRLTLPAAEVRSLALRELRYQAIRQNEEYQFRTRSLLHSLRQYLRSFKHFEGRKLLIFLSSGFIAGDVRYELQDVVTAALKSGVVMNAIDIRGLYTTIEAANEAGVRSPDSILRVAKTANRISEMSAQKEPLSQLANETGGMFVHNTNDLPSGLQQIVERNSINYVLSYASPAAPADGRYHSIKLEVLRPGVRLDYRKGYYSPKQETSFVRRKGQDILDALSAPGDLNEIPIELSYDCLRLEDGRFELGLVMQVQTERVPFLLEEERQQNLLHFLAAVFDANGQYIDGLEKALELKLTETSYRSFKSHGFSSKAQFKLPPGHYKIKVVVRESVQSKMGSVSKEIHIP